MKTNFMLDIALVLVISILLAACTANNSQETIVQTASVPTPTLAQPAPASPPATPKSQLPTAGICAEPESEFVTIEIHAEVPSPRCTKVKAEQQLRVINKTDAAVQVSIAQFAAQLAPDEAYVIDENFGVYLAPGVHRLSVLGGAGPAEIWLPEE